VIFRNAGLRGGVASARKYIPDLLDDALVGRFNPDRVFDCEIAPTSRHSRRE